jgi:hypothetical protein
MIRNAEAAVKLELILRSYMSYVSRIIYLRDINQMSRLLSH